MRALRALILAAGRGSRLGCQSGPKCLVPLRDGETLLARQIRILSRWIPSEFITVTVGYREERVRRALPSLNYLTLPDYDRVNTAASALCGLSHLKGQGDLLLLNGDVVFNTGVIERLVHREGNIAVVNRALVGEEEMKYTTSRAGEIAELSKSLSVDVAEGEAVGIWRFEGAVLHLLHRTLRQISPTDLYEAGIVEAIRSGMKLLPLLVDENDCVEVDFPGDLERANRFCLVSNVPFSGR